MSKKDCLIFTSDAVINTNEIWSKQKFSIRLNSFSELLEKTHVILATESFKGAFEIKFFEIPKDTSDFNVFVHFSKFYKRKESSPSVIGLFAGQPEISNAISGVCSFNHAYDKHKFEEVDFPDKHSPVDLQSMKESIKKLYGQDIEITIKLRD